MNMKPVTLVIPPQVLARAEALYAAVAPHLGGASTPTDILRMALLHGLDGLEERLRTERGGRSEPL